MDKRYLIDTNVIIDFSANKLPQKGKILISDIIDHEPNISVINKIELLGFSVVAQPIVEFVKIATILSLTDKVVIQSIAIRKQHKIKLPDAIIAATALTYNLQLVTRNSKDFAKIHELEIINPYEI